MRLFGFQWLGHGFERGNDMVVRVTKNRVEAVIQVLEGMGEGADRLQRVRDRGQVRRRLRPRLSRRLPAPAARGGARTGGPGGWPANVNSAPMPHRVLQIIPSLERSGPEGRFGRPGDISIRRRAAPGRRADRTICR